MRVFFIACLVLLALSGSHATVDGIFLKELEDFRALRPKDSDLPEDLVIDGDPEGYLKAFQEFKNFKSCLAVQRIT